MDRTVWTFFSPYSGMLRRTSEPFGGPEDPPPRRNLFGPRSSFGGLGARAAMLLLDRQTKLPTLTGADYVHDVAYDYYGTRLIAYDPWTSRIRAGN